MENDLLKFLNGEVNVACFEGLIMRETLPNGVEHYVVRNFDPKGKEHYVCEEYRRIHQEAKDDKPKHIGGRKPYVMLMTQEIDNLRKKGIKNTEELLGCLVCLSGYIEWSTGRLIHKRSKKPVQYKDLKKIFPYGNRKLNRILKDLKDNDLLENTQEGYCLSRRIIKKGKSKEGGR